MLSGKRIYRVLPLYNESMSSPLPICNPGTLEGRSYFELSI